MTVGGKGAARLDKWLADQLPQYSRARLKSWIDAGVVEVDGAVATARQPVYTDQVVRAVPQPLAEDLAFLPEEMALSILYQDDSLFVIDKPAQLVVHPAAGNWSGTLLNGLLHLDPALARVPRAGIVHRLDKDTTGLMVVARTPEAQTDLVRQLQARTVRREYLALAAGHPQDLGDFDGAIGRHPKDRLKMAVLADGMPGARSALTHYRVLARGALNGAPVALLRMRLETGRTHQIRVHLAHAGFPIAGDPVYAATSARALFSRQALHAERLGLFHPKTGAAMQWQCDPPSDMAELLGRASLQFLPAV